MRSRYPVNIDRFKVETNAISKSVLDLLLELYVDERAEWERVEQLRPDHYSHVFKFNSPLLPDKNEAYQAKFSRSSIIEANDTFKSIVQDQIIPKIEYLTGQSLSEHDIRAYRLDSGDFYRAHIDGYASTINWILYLNKRWKLDWGGLLHLLNEDNGEISTIIPEGGKLMLINNENFSVPHCVSEVSTAAAEPRFTIVGFSKL